MDQVREHFKIGDKVMLRIVNITSREDYKNANPGYRAFVDAADGKVFTVDKVDRTSTIIGLKESHPWLFWYDDLGRVNEGA